MKIVDIIPDPAPEKFRFQCQVPNKVEKFMTTLCQEKIRSHKLPTILATFIYLWFYYTVDKSIKIIDNNLFAAPRIKLIWIFCIKFFLCLYSTYSFSRICSTSEVASWYLPCFSLILAFAEWTFSFIKTVCNKCIMEDDLFAIHQNNVSTRMQQVQLQLRVDI